MLKFFQDSCWESWERSQNWLSSIMSYFQFAIIWNVITWLVGSYLILAYGYLVGSLLVNINSLENSLLVFFWFGGILLPSLVPCSWGVANLKWLFWFFEHENLIWTCEMLCVNFTRLLNIWSRKFILSLVFFSFLTIYITCVFINYRFHEFFKKIIKRFPNPNSIRTNPNFKYNPNPKYNPKSKLNRTDPKANLSKIFIWSDWIGIRWIFSQSELSESNFARPYFILCLVS